MDLLRVEQPCCCRGQVDLRFIGDADRKDVRDDGEDWREVRAWQGKARQGNQMRSRQPPRGVAFSCRDWSGAIVTQSGLPNPTALGRPNARRTLPAPPVAYRHGGGRPECAQPMALRITKVYRLD